MGVQSPSTLPTEATGISRVGIARVRLEINSLILAHQKVFEH